MLSLLKFASPPYAEGIPRAANESSGATATLAVERPVASFVLTLIAGVLVLGGSATVMGFSSGAPYYGGMMGGYYYGGMMGGYYGMMRGLGFGGGGLYGLAAIGVVSGIIILLGAIMVYNQPAKASTWGPWCSPFRS
jgi:hypothetical protein